MSETAGVWDRNRVSSQAADPRRVVLQRYGRFYGPMALMGLAITFVPLFGVVVDDEGRIVRSYGSMWETGGAAPVLGLLVSFVLVGLLVAATLGDSQGFVLPLSITLWTFLPLLMLTSKFGIPDPKPELTPVGDLALGLMVGLVLITFTHTIHAVMVRTGWRL